MGSRRQTTHDCAKGASEYGRPKNYIPVGVVAGDDGVDDGVVCVVVGADIGDGVVVVGVVVDGGNVVVVDGGIVVTVK